MTAIYIPGHTFFTRVLKYISNATYICINVITHIYCDDVIRVQHSLQDCSRRSVDMSPRYKPQVRHHQRNEI